MEGEVVQEHLFDRFRRRYDWLVGRSWLGRDLAFELALLLISLKKLREPGWRESAVGRVGDRFLALCYISKAP